MPETVDEDEADWIRKERFLGLRRGYVRILDGLGWSGMKVNLLSMWI
jgi:hypothetical protein